MPQCPAQPALRPEDRAGSAFSEDAPPTQDPPPQSEAACAAREPCYVATLRPVPRPDPLKRRRWSRSSGQPLTTCPIRPASAPACTSGPKTGGKMCGRPGVENPAGRYARSHCMRAAVLEDRGSDGGTATVSWRGRSAEPASGARFFDRGWSGAFPRGSATHRSETHSPPIRVSCVLLHSW